MEAFLKKKKKTEESFLGLFIFVLFSATTNGGFFACRLISSSKKKWLIKVPKGGVVGELFRYVLVVPLVAFDRNHTRSFRFLVR